jgi:hypothetical protein
VPGRPDCMSNRPRRRGPDRRRLAPVDPDGPDLSCGCSHLAVIEFDATCGECGGRVREHVTLPSSGQVGDSREVGASCPCGGEAEGIGTIVEILDH